MLAVVALTASLGNWQLNRAAERLQAQELQDQRVASGPVRLNQRMSNSDELAGSAVTVTGRWHHDKTVLLDNRTHERQAGFHVFTPLELDPANSALPAYVLVLRGWAPRNNQDRSLLPPIPTPDGKVEILGRLEPDIEQTLVLGSDAEPAAAQRIWQRLDRASYERWSGLALRPFIVRQTAPLKAAAKDGLVRQWISPGSKVDRHYGYAFQWFAMSMAMFSFWVWLTFLRRAKHADE